LHADRPFGVIEAQVPPRLLAPPTQPLGADELADDHVRAETPADPAERRLADAGLWRQIERDPAAREDGEETVIHGRTLTRLAVAINRRSNPFDTLPRVAYLGWGPREITVTDMEAQRGTARVFQ